MAKDETMFTQAQVDEAVKKAMGATKSENSLDVASLLKQILPATIMAMEQAKAQSGHDANLKAQRAKLALEEKCHICGQSVGDGKGRGCGGPWARAKDGSFTMEKDKEGVEHRVEDASQFHTRMAVFPNDPIAINQFDGIKINGAHYRSQGPDDKVWVPKNNNIAAMLIDFERDQRTQQIGRKFMRNSGSVGKSGAQTTPVTFS